jgi:hypothetical protein
MAKRPPKPPDRDPRPRHRRRGKSVVSPRTISTLIRQRPTLQDFDQLDREVKYVHPRSATILLAAEVELNLELSILTKLPRNDNETTKLLVDRDGPLSSFYAKIHLAYAMGIITEGSVVRS